VIHRRYDVIRLDVLPAEASIGIANASRRSRSRVS
jgi:hypothetical protein